MDPTPRTIELPPLDFRAAVGAVDDEDRTVELIWSTGSDVIRYDWMSDTRYIERLSMKPAHVRLERLNSGAPLLNAHSSWDLADQIGVVEDNSAKVDGKKGRAVVRFSKRDAVEPYFRDVKDRIIRNVSVGYRVHKFEETKAGTDNNKMPVRLATDWEPYEISMVPLPADAAAQTVMSAKRNAQLLTNPCVLVMRGIDLASSDDADRFRRLRLAKAHK